MRSGYTAVVVPATLAEVSYLLREGRPGAHVLELGHGAIALETAEGQHDSAAYQALAAKAAELFGSAVLVVCALPHARQSAQVFRRGERPHLFRLPSIGPREAVSPLSEESEESSVVLPLVEGLELAGLKGRELAGLLCKQLGKHEHSSQEGRDK